MSMVLSPDKKAQEAIKKAAAEEARLADEAERAEVAEADDESTNDGDPAPGRADDQQNEE